MTFVPLDIQPGLRSDDTEFEVGQTGWTDCSNVRPWRGQGEVIGGWETATLDMLDGVARSIHVWDGPTQQLVAIGTNTKLYVLSDGELIDITPDDFTAGSQDGLGGNGYGTGAYGAGDYGEPSQSDAFALTWSLDNRGTTLVANPRGQGIFIWDEGDAKGAPLTNAPTVCTYMRVSSQRQVIAYGTQEESSGDFNPRAIRWSDILDPTDWTTATDNNAGEFVLEDAGRLVGAIEVADAALVMTDNAVYQEDFLGNPGQTYAYRKLGDKSGLAGPNAMCEIGGVVYFIDRSFKLWAGALNTSPIRIINPVSTELTDRLDPIQRDKIFMCSLSQFREVWIFFQSRGAADVDGYVAYNVETDLWFKGDLARSAFKDATPAQYPMGISPSGNVFIHEKGRSANGGPISWFVDSGDITLSMGQRAIKVRGVRPDFAEQVGAVNLTLFAKPYPQSAKDARITLNMPPDKEKVDFLYSGLFSQFRLSGNTAPARCRFGKLTFDIGQGGRR